LNLNIGELMGKILCFIYDTMADFETNLACHMLGDAEKQSIAIGYEKVPYEGLSYMQFMPKMTVKEALELDDVDGLIIPGGWERDCREELIELINKLHSKNKLIAAICAAPEFLAKAGILQNHKYTTTINEESRNKMKDLFPSENFIDKRVVVDKNVITAVGSAYREFGISILDYFESFDNEEERKSYIEMYKG